MFSRQMGSRAERSTACAQTQGRSGDTSQFPFARTPPHGPLRKFFGQRMGQVSPVECRIHCPHIRQSNIVSLLIFSMGRMMRSRTFVEAESSEINFILSHNRSPLIITSTIDGHQVELM